MFRVILTISLALGHARITSTKHNMKGYDVVLFLDATRCVL